MNNCILTDEVKTELFQIKRIYFEMGDKLQNLLARQLRGLKASRAMHQIKSKLGEVISDPNVINDVFREYYQQLYSSKVKGNSSDWLAHLYLPRLSEAAKDMMEDDITIQEIVNVIKSFPNCKSSGPDGYGIDFFKKYSEVLALLLLRMFTHSFDIQTLPNTL